MKPHLLVPLTLAAVVSLSAADLVFPFTDQDVPEANAATRERPRDLEIESSDAPHPTALQSLPGPFGPTGLQGSAGAQGPADPPGQVRLRGTTTVGLASPPPRVAELTLTPNSGAPGASLRARGVVSPARPVELRAYWEQGGLLRLVGRGQAGVDGGFDLALTVPTDASAGPGRLALGSSLGSPESLAFAAFTVVTPPPARIAGIVRNSAGQAAGAGIEVRLAGPDGLAVAQTVTDRLGGFSFPGLSPDSYQVQVMTGGYPPETVFLLPGEDFEVQIDPSEAYLEPIPAVYLLSAGAVALPGGSYSGNQPVQVGDWMDVPMARLLSLKGKGLAPLQVRFWAEVQRGSLGSGLPLGLWIELRKGSQVIASASASVPKTVYGEGKLDFPAFTLDVNSLELPPGKLTLAVTAVTALLILPWPVGHWEFPVEVVDLAGRWYAGHVKNPKLSVTRQDFYTLRYAFSGALPKLPGVGTPLFNESLDLGLVTVDNTFNLGIELKEWIENHGAWDGSATAKADLTLFDVGLIDEQRKFFRQGPSLGKATYQMDPLVKPLIQDICFPIYGAALPSPIDLCGLEINGKVGVNACFGGQVALYADILADLRTTATVAPGFNLALPIGANLELGPCKATAEIRPDLGISVPIKLEPWHTPSVYWDGLCIQISGKATAALGCCGLGINKSVDLFDPVEIGNCPKHAGGVTLHNPGEGPISAPPRRASIAYSPAGYAAAVWENFEPTPRGWVRTAPVVSVFDGVSWSEPRPIAGPDLAGWEPQIAFLDGQNAAIAWVVPNFDTGRGGVQLAGAHLHGLCDIAGKIVDVGCSVVQTAATVVKVICLGFCGLSAANPADAAPAGAPDEVVVLGGGPLWNVRPVLATDPENRGAVVVWLREQEPIHGRQQTFALYYSRLGRGGWSAPERVDPDSNFFDLQPALRFDRAGQPSAVWVRDFDGDLETQDDRTLVFSRLEGPWTPPETLVPLPSAPWTPSLDFDLENQPVVAFVVPATHPRTGELLGPDGTLSTLHAARRIGRAWSSSPVGNDLRAEGPVIRVTQDNHALVFCRAFGGHFGQVGQVASAIANLADAEPRWSAGPLAADARMHWHAAAELNPTNGAPLVFWESRDPAAPDAEPQLHGLPRPWAVDLALGQPGLTFSTAYPTPGTPVEVTARLVNLGLKPLGAARLEVAFYDREPARGVEPFASQTVAGPLALGEDMPVTVRYTPSDRAWRTFYVVADATELIAESEEANNRAETPWGGLAAPEDFQAAPIDASGSVRLSWTRPAADGATRFWLWRTNVRTGESELLGGTNGETFVDDTAIGGVDYDYHLIAADTQGVRSAASASGSVTAPVLPPEDPDLLRLHLVTFGGALTLTWTGLPAVQLEAADELAGDRTAWRPVTEGITRFGGVAQITLPAVQSQRFFRLVSP